MPVASDYRPVIASVPDMQLNVEGQRLVLQVKSFDVKVVELLAERALVAPNGPCLRIQPYASVEVRTAKKTKPQLTKSFSLRR